MARQNKKRKGRQSNAQVMERVERELRKGNAKTALKDAKVLYRSEATSEARRLLEVAYADRVEQLHRQNLVSEAQSLLSELLALKPGHADVCERLPRLQVLVGDKDADPERLFEQQPELLIDLTDRAVLDWKSLAPEHAGLPAQVNAVRQSLSAIESGNDDEAAQLLQDIPRTSPLGDWKLFARGLSAFYQGDGDRTSANWQRLDPGRPAQQIARTLQATLGNANAEDTATVAGRVKRLESQIGRDQGYEQLVSLSESWRQGDWRTFFNHLRRFRQRYEKSHEATLQRITELAWRRAVREVDYDLHGRLMRGLPAPELDPQWNRLRGLFAERSNDYDVTAVEMAWEAYARDLRELTCLRDDERPVAESLVYLRLGRKLIEFAHYNESLMGHPWIDDEDKDESEGDMRKSAAQFLRRSIQACPRLTEAYRQLAELHEETEDFDKAASVYEKLLKQMPDNFDANVWLARFYLERDEPLTAEPYTSTALRLKPRDQQCLALEWLQQVTTVRCLTKKRKLDEARAALKKLHDVRPPSVELFTLDLAAAAIEFKAKDQDAGNRFVDDAVARLEEPTAAWLHMSYTAARYSLSRDIKKVFDQRYKEAIENVPTSRTAGLLAKFFMILKVTQINYTGRATQERLALAYLKRATDVSWAERDICDVCEWLLVLPRFRWLLEQMIDTAVHLFPTSPRLLFFAGAKEMMRGPFLANIEYARDCFSRAIESSEGASQPLSREQIERARETLSQLEEIADQAPTFGPPLGFFDDDDDESGSDEGPLGGSGMFGAGGIDLLPPGFDMDEMLDSLPPEVRRELKQAAAAGGLSLEQALLGILAMSVEAESLEPPKPRRRGRVPQSNQTKFGFTDDE